MLLPGSGSSSAVVGRAVLSYGRGCTPYRVSASIGSSVATTLKEIVTFIPGRGTLGSPVPPTVNIWIGGGVRVTVGAVLSVMDQVPLSVTVSSCCVGVSSSSDRDPEAVPVRTTSDPEGEPRIESVTGSAESEADRAGVTVSLWTVVDNESVRDQRP